MKLTSTIEQKKRGCWEEYCQTHPLCDTPVMRLNFNWTFDRAYALGKQEKDADTVIQGWACRDNNSLNAQVLIGDKPKRTGFNYWENKSADCITLPKDLFPDLTWSDEPQEVEIIIKRKKNGTNS